jgi:hypothetical protein
MQGGTTGQSELAEKQIREHDRGFPTSRRSRLRTTYSGCLPKYNHPHTAIVFSQRHYIWCALLLLIITSTLVLPCYANDVPGVSAERSVAPQGAYQKLIMPPAVALSAASGCGRRDEVDGALTKKIDQRQSEKQPVSYPKGILFLLPDSRYPIKYLEDCVAQQSLALRVRPHDARAYELRGIAHFLLNRRQPAKEDLEEALAISSTKMSPAALLKLGECYALENEHLKAVYCFDQAIRHKPPSALLLARCYLRRAQSFALLNNYPKAIADADEVVRLNKDRVWVYEFRERLNWNAQRYQKVVDDCNKAIRLLPDSTSNYAMRANAYAKLGKSDLAAQDREKLNELGKFLD